MSTTSRGPSRRTLVKGAAWSVPVVAVAGAAPALAASPIITPPTSRPGEACKHPGNSCGARLRDAYHFVFCISNLSDQDITVNFTLMSFADGRRDRPLPGSVVVPADGVEHCYTTHVINMGNSSNGQATLAWNYTYRDAQDNPVYVEGTSQTGVNALPPCASCDDGSTPDSADASAEAEATDYEATEAPGESDAAEPAAPEGPAAEPAEAPANSDLPPAAPAPAPVDGDGSIEGQND